MQLLFLLQGRTPHDQIGFHSAFTAMEHEGKLDLYSVLPYRSEHPSCDNHWEILFNTALQTIENCGIDVLFFQFFHGAYPDPRPFIAEARRINPNLLVMTSCGDPFGRWAHPAPQSLRQAASVSDVTFSTSMGYIADALVSSGAKNVVLIPNGVCQQRFGAPSPEPRSVDWDVIFIGSNNGGRNPFTHLSRAGRKRKAMVQTLERHYGKRFALFGRGWEGHPSWQGTVPYADQHLALRRARVQVGGFPGSYATYYTSDRFYIALASGVPLLDCHVPGVSALAKEGCHWIPYRDLAGLLKASDQMLNQSTGDLEAFGARARAFVLDRQTQAHRAEEMLDIAKALMSARAKGRVASPPLLRCFHDEVDPELELPRAVQNWVG